jgi:hypothetical protein
VLASFQTGVQGLIALFSDNSSFVNNSVIAERFQGGKAHLGGGALLAFSAYAVLDVYITNSSFIENYVSVVGSVAQGSVMLCGGGAILFADDQVCGPECSLYLGFSVFLHNFASVGQIRNLGDMSAGGGAILIAAQYLLRLHYCNLTVRCLFVVGFVHHAN